MSKNKEQQIDIQLDEKVAQGVYSNLVVINHSNTEFVMDFVSVLPGVPKGQVRSRIILTPQHAKSLKDALLENIDKFEKANGSISDSAGSISIPLNFGVTGEA